MLKNIENHLKINLISNIFIIKKTNFFAALPKHNLKTFGSAKYMILEADRNIFIRLLVATPKRKMDMKEDLKNEVGPIPLSLGSVTRFLNKTTNFSEK